jgi:hypothetical protein
VSYLIAGYAFATLFLGGFVVYSLAQLRHRP